jgi:hypothetical protein
MTAALNPRGASPPRAVKGETRDFERERADEKPQSRRARDRPRDFRGPPGRVRPAGSRLPASAR